MPHVITASEPSWIKSAADRLVDHTGPLPALHQRQRFRRGTVLIVDGTLVPARDHRVAEQSKNYRYSTNHQVAIDADSQLIKYRRSVALAPETYAYSVGRPLQHRQVLPQLERGHLAAVLLPLLALVAQEVTATPSDLTGSVPTQG